MPRRKVREYQAKQLFNQHFKRFSTQPLDIKCAQVAHGTNYETLVSAHPWLVQDKLVVKPDMLFGKRGKNNLVLLKASLSEAKIFIEERMGKPIEIGGLKGVVDHFVVEPFLPHTEEFYFSIVCSRDKNTLGFSSCGGIEIEENWEKVKHLDVLVGDSIDKADLSVLFDHSIATTTKAAITEFIKTCYKIFEDLNYHFLEMNPFALTSSGQPYPLDMRAEVDDCAHFKNGTKWKVNGTEIEFPNAFGKTFCEEEKVVKGLDELTGASLKLTVLNQSGSIWGMIAGGGASVIYADTVADLGFGHELGNYGEYSGDPSEADTYQYAIQLLSLATHTNGDPHKRRALLIGGAIANFTDVAATFLGIIHALRDFKDRLVRSNIKIFVRRGGPNYKIGLQKMRDLESELGIPIEVFGPEANMTRIVKLGIAWVNNDDSLTLNKDHINGNGVVHKNAALHA